jgi:hypothetical protein
MTLIPPGCYIVGNRFRQSRKNKLREKTAANKEKMYSGKKISRKENVMAVKKRTNRPEEMRCATCRIRQRAEANPNSFMSRLWKWHTGWCPGWKAYQKALAEAGA